jgi:alkaline phosphatase D
MMGHLRFRASDNLPLGVLNFDQWDGYAAARQRLFDVITENDLKNVVVLSGDIHSSWANELTPDPNDPARYDPATGEGAVAVEFVGTSVTSPGLAALQPALLDRVRAANPHVKWVDISKRGWLSLDITPERTQATWMHFERIREEMPPQVPYVGGVWAVRDGVPRLVQEAEPAAPRADAPPLAE